MDEAPAPEPVLEEPTITEEPPLPPPPLPTAAPELPDPVADEPSAVDPIGTGLLEEEPPDVGVGDVPEDADGGVELWSTGPDDTSDEEETSDPVADDGTGIDTTGDDGNALASEEDDTGSTVDPAGTDETSGDAGTGSTDPGSAGTSASTFAPEETEEEDSSEPIDTTDPGAADAGDDPSENVAVATTDEPTADEPTTGENDDEGAVPAGAIDAEDPSENVAVTTDDGGTALTAADGDPTEPTDSASPSPTAATEDPPAPDDSPIPDTADQAPPQSPDDPPPPETTSGEGDPTAADASDPALSDTSGEQQEAPTGSDPQSGAVESDPSGTDQQPTDDHVDPPPVDDLETSPDDAGPTDPVDPPDPDVGTLGPGDEQPPEPVTDASTNGAGDPTTYGLVDLPPADGPEPQLAEWGQTVANEPLEPNPVATDSPPTGARPLMPDNALAPEDQHVDQGEVLWNDPGLQNVVADLNSTPEPIRDSACREASLDPGTRPAWDQVGDRLDEPMSQQEARASARAAQQQFRDENNPDYGVQAGHTTAVRNANESGISADDLNQRMMALQSRHGQGEEAAYTDPETGDTRIRTPHTMQEKMIDDAVERARAGSLPPGVDGPTRLDPQGQWDAGSEVLWRTENTPLDARNADFFREFQLRGDPSPEEYARLVDVARAAGFDENAATNMANGLVPELFRTRDGG